MIDKLSDIQIKNNYNEFLNNVKKTCGDRVESLLKMYEDLQFSLMYSPASSYGHMHNSFKGGYTDHVNRVLLFSFKVYENWKTLGLDVSNFSPEELAFAAIHHDLGKLGFPGEGNNKYVINSSDWHIRNLGKNYNINELIPFSLVQHQSLFLLQKYSIPISWNEYIGILTHDGLYDQVNDPYFLSKSAESKFRCNLPLILHQADLMAAQFEYEQWKNKEKPHLINYTT